MSRKVLENTNEMCSCPPGHPIILLKSNEFNMAAVSVKRSIGDTEKQIKRDGRERDSNPGPLDCESGALTSPCMANHQAS